MVLCGRLQNADTKRQSRDVARHSQTQPMTIKNLVDNFINQNDKIQTFLEDVGSDYKNADKIIPQFVDTLNQTQFNSSLGLDFANVLQLTNDKTLIDQYELTDIQRLFDSLLRFEKLNLDLYVDTAYFEWAVMDNVEKAKEIINLGINNGLQKIAELKKLLDDINNS